MNEATFVTDFAARFWSTLQQFACAGAALFVLLFANWLYQHYVANKVTR